MILSAGKKQYFCAHLSADVLNIHSTMDTCHLAEDDLLDYLKDFQNIYIEKTAPILNESRPKTLYKNWFLLPDLTNPAVTQAKFVLKKLQTSPKPWTATQFSYKEVEPLYIQNASITINHKIR